MPMSCSNAAIRITAPWMPRAGPGRPGGARGGERAADAIAAFRAARTITSAPGIVGRVKRLLDAMAPADAAGILAPIFRASEGRKDAVAS